MQLVVDVKLCSRLVSRMVNIPILGRFHRYVRGIEVTILSNSAVKYKPNTTSLPFKRPLVHHIHDLSTTTQRKRWRIDYAGCPKEMREVSSINTALDAEFVGGV
jgi:hypothetical protein